MTRIVCLCCVVFALAANPGRAGDYDKPDAPAGLDRAARDEKARLAFIKGLGDGSVYQVDILYRGHDDGRLYLCQTVFSRQRPHSAQGFPGLGLDDKGKAIAPPDPGYQRLQRLEQELEKTRGEPALRPWYPPAQRTHAVGAHLDKEYPGGMTIRVSDMSTVVKLPEAPGEIAVALFHWRFFRIERLSREAVPKKPSDFGLHNVPERLLAERLTSSVEDRERMETAAVFPQQHDWLFFTATERSRAVAQVLAWFKK